MNESRVLVIGHRGASGHRPENTLGAFELAYRLGADSVELDLVATKDGHLVCRHDLFLKDTTDVANRPEFAHLRFTLEGDKESYSDWCVNDFTLAELKQLRCRERWPRKRRNSASYDGKWAIPTLGEVLSLADEMSHRQGRELMVHAELKSVVHQRGLGLDLPELCRDLPDTSRVTWMSFEAEGIADLRDRPRVQLFNHNLTSEYLEMCPGHATAVAVRCDSVFPRTDGFTGDPSGVVAHAHALGLDVLVWTLRAENKHLPKNLRIGKSSHGHGDAVGEASMMLAAGVDGLISDFPETAAAARASGRRVRPAVVTTASG